MVMRTEVNYHIYSNIQYIIILLKKGILERQTSIKEKACHVLNHFCPEGLAHRPCYYYKQYCKYFCFRKMDKIDLNPGYLLNGYLNNQLSKNTNDKTTLITIMQLWKKRKLRKFNYTFRCDCENYDFKFKSWTISSLQFLDKFEIYVEFSNNKDLCQKIKTRNISF